MYLVINLIAVMDELNLNQMIHFYNIQICNKKNSRAETVYFMITKVTKQLKNNNNGNNIKILTK